MESDMNRRQKGFYILLALLLASIFWLYVDVFGNNGGPRLVEREILEVPVTYVGEASLADRGLMMLPEGSTESIDITVTGSRFRTARVTRDDIRVLVDLSRVESSGTQSVSYRAGFVTNKGFTTDMITDYSISSAVVNITELNNRTVDVVCELVGNLAEGYSAGQPQLSQSSLEIRGQAEDIDPVSYVKVTLDIGQNAMESISQALSFRYYDENDQELSGEGIHPTVQTIQATLPVYVTKELQLTVDFQEYPGLRRANLSQDIQPSTITVSGEAGLLRGIDSITLGKLDLLDLYSSDIRRHTFSIIVPEGCENLSGVTRATLNIEFRDLATAEVAASRFEYTNPPAGKQVEFLTDAVGVTLFGTSADVEAVSGEDITITVDLSGYSGASGTYTVPAQVQVNTNGDVGVSGTYQLQLSIREPEPPSEESGGGEEGPAVPEE